MWLLINNRGGFESNNLRSKYDSCIGYVTGRSYGDVRFAKEEIIYNKFTVLYVITYNEQVFIIFFFLLISDFKTYNNLTIKKQGKT